MTKTFLTKNERKKQTVAIIILLIVLMPIVLIYFSFFSLAFFTREGEFTWHNFDFLYTDMKLKESIIKPITQAMKNSVLFTIVVTLCEVSISCLAGYALSRLRFFGRKTIEFSVLALRMFPGLLLLIAVLYVLLTLGIVNSLFGVVLVAIAFRIPGSTFIIKNFFDGVPQDIENSTLVDGCTRFSAFYQVIVHLVKPGIASIAVFSFLSAWSNYILFTALIFNSKTPVIATYLRAISRNEQMIASYGVFAAMSIIYMLPVIVFFVISQKQLMEGTMGRGKGV